MAKTPALQEPYNHEKDMKEVLEILTNILTHLEKISQNTVVRF